MKNRLVLRSGKYWDLDDPLGSANHITITDIATSLSLINRYNGHTKRPLSVAEHSVWCSIFAPPEHAFQALLHDIAEAITGDLRRPLKNKLGEAWYKIEAPIEFALFRKFGVPDLLSAEVTETDDRMAETEMRQLVEGYTPREHIKPFPVQLADVAYGPAGARWMFLWRFESLCKAAARG